MADETTGPVNRDRPGNISPFAGFDNRIRYSDMVGYSAMQQYYQNTITPHHMAIANQRAVATQPNFQYGVPGGQDRRAYTRQAQLNQMSVSGTVFKTVSDIAAFDIAAGAATALGMGGVYGLAAPIAAVAAPMALLHRGINRAMERQQFMHQTAADIEQYRERLGFNQPLSYNQATALGSSMTTSMMKGGFFSQSQQSRIHKIGLSNDMMSARGGGINSGELTQYQRNFEELKETTEEVVKLLQTTIEGGMSVIKELQGSGFHSMSQIKQQVRQAKAFGTFTGLGAQNMMGVGAAGAQAVQGTPWRADVGASMFQMGAFQAASMSQGSGAGAYAVQRVGGVAAAGGVIARAQMNALSSGMGTKFAAYMMKADGSLDEDRLQRVMGGRVSGYEIVTGANQRGYAMGASGRALFELNKEELYNNMSDMQRQRVFNAEFNAWGSGRNASMEAKAAVFAGQFTNNIRDQRLVMQNLLSPQGFGQMSAAGAGTRLNAMGAVGADSGSSVWGRIKSGGSAVLRSTDQIGESIMFGMQGMGAGISSAWSGGVGYLGSKISGELRAVGFVDQYWNMSDPDLGSRSNMINMMYGSGAQGNIAKGMQYAMGSGRGMNVPASAGVRAAMGTSVSGEMNIDLSGLTGKQLRRVLETSSIATAHGTEKLLLQDSGFTRDLSLKSNSRLFEAFQDNPKAANAMLARTIISDRDNANTKYRSSKANFDTYIDNMKNDKQKTDARNNLVDARLGFGGAKGEFHTVIQDLVASESLAKKFQTIADHRALGTGVIGAQKAFAGDVSKIFTESVTFKGGYGDVTMSSVPQVLRNVFGGNMNKTGNQIMAFKSMVNLRNKKAAGTTTLEEDVQFKKLSPFIDSKAFRQAEESSRTKDAFAFFDYADKQHAGYMRFAAENQIELTDQFKGDLQRVMNLSFGSDPLAWARKNKKQLSSIGITSGALSQIKDEKGLVGMLVNNQAIQGITSSQRSSDMANAIRDLTQLAAGYSKNVKIQLGDKDDRERVISDPAEAARLIPALKSAYDLEQRAMRSKTDERISLASPQLNYFSNRWAY